MTEVVYKYVLCGDGIPACRDRSLTLPDGARYLHAAFQKDGHELCLWFLIDNDEKKTVERVFRVVYTGTNLGEAKKGQYLLFRETVLTPDATFVVHVFEHKDTVPPIEGSF